VKAVLRAPAFAVVALIDTAERLFASSGGLYRLLFAPGLENTRWNLGIWRAWRGFYMAHGSVPAYRDFIAKHGGMPDLHLTPGLFPDLAAIPEMDKASYVKAYPIHERIKGGKLPRKGVMVDESSGSSGQPTS
jgi:phenylacetate-CoA ligase